MYTFKIPIGDWSGDGHGKCKYYLVKSNKPITEVRELHFKIESKTGINIEDICSDYEDNCISNEIVDILSEIGYKFSEKSIEVYGDDITIYPDAMADLWIFLLMKVDDSLNLEIINDDVAMLSFYGFDDEGRHIGFVGYGCFN